MDGDRWKHRQAGQRVSGRQIDGDTVTLLGEEHTEEYSENINNPLKPCCTTTVQYTLSGRASHYEIRAIL